MMDVLPLGKISLRVFFPFLIIQGYPDVDNVAAAVAASDDDDDDGNELGEKDLFY